MFKSYGCGYCLYFFGYLTDAQAWCLRPEPIHSRYRKTVSEEHIHRVWPGRTIERDTSADSAGHVLLLVLRTFYCQEVFVHVATAAFPRYS